MNDAIYVPGHEIGQIKVGAYSLIWLHVNPIHSRILCEENWDSKPTFEAINWFQLCRSGCVLHLEGLDDNGRFSEFNLG